MVSSKSHARGRSFLIHKKNNESSPIELPLPDFPQDTLNTENSEASSSSSARHKRRKEKLKRRKIKASS